MALYTLYRSVEPARPLGDLARGVRADVADPVWFLARQWQLGEHQGEDASSPVVVEAHVAHTKIEYDATRPHLDPTVIPAEALLEAEPDDWWTIGRRYRLGRASATFRCISSAFGGGTVGARGDAGESVTTGSAMGIGRCTSTARPPRPVR